MSGQPIQGHRAAFFSMTVPTLRALEELIEEFAPAFDSLTAACNSCHQATNFGFNVVTRPAGNAFLNQEFSPMRKRN